MCWETCCYSFLLKFSFGWMHGSVVDFTAFSPCNTDNKQLNNMHILKE